MALANPSAGQEQSYRHRDQTYGPSREGEGGIN